MVNSINGYPQIQATNFSGVNPQQTLIAQNYTTNPYANDSFEKKSESTVGKVAGKVAFTAIALVLARKFVPGLKNYTKVIDNPTLKQKVANVVVTAADTLTAWGTKALTKIKGIAGNIGKKGVKTAQATESVVVGVSEKEVAKQMIQKGSGLSEQMNFFKEVYKPEIVGNKLALPSPDQISKIA